MTDSPIGETQQNRSMNSILDQPRPETEPHLYRQLGGAHANTQRPNSDLLAQDTRESNLPHPTPQTILVPLALSSGSYAALAIAKKLASESRAKLVLLHAVQLNIAGEEHGIPRTRLLNELCQHAELQLSALAECVGEPATTEVLVCEGRPAEAIVAAARRLRADMIVMCTRGHRRCWKWLHRNTALHVMRQATCQIWLVAPGKRRATVNLTMVNHTRVNRPPEPEAAHENQNRFRSLFRVLFS
jgi:nucleotide-binding universal stress UspA family protein